MRWLVCVILASALGCRPADVPEAPRSAPSIPAATDHVHALLLNGGGSKAQNFQSHLLHVQQLHEQLVRAGIDPSRISVFSSDGEDAEADVALRSMQPADDFWLVEGTRLEPALRPPIIFANTEVEDAHVRPATRAALAEWFADSGARLGPGDILLLYVTDHGTKNAEDTSNNRITLWGKEETLSVYELGRLLAGLHPAVRVVTVMSQCYSGAFARLAVEGTGSDRAPGSMCGYFSSTADRPAYGCYPENRGRANVGHSFHFLEAFAVSGRLADAHAEVLVRDATPDVPLRTSDVYLQELLDRGADAGKTDRVTFADALLDEAWHDRAAWEPDIRLLDRIGHAFGVFSPRSLQELAEQQERIETMAEQLKTHGRAWESTRESLARANLDRFLGAHKEWTTRVADGALAGKPEGEIEIVRAELLQALGDATASDETVAERFVALRTNTDTAKAAGYRMDVRLGVVLRMRALLTSIAGRQYLTAHGSESERATYAALRECEQLTLPPAPPPAGTELERADPFPVLADDVELAGTVLPAWLGIQFRQTKEPVRAKLGLAEGAASVLALYPDSPARMAGLKEGDIVVGPSGTAFEEKEQIREWAMRSVPDVPAVLDVVRDAVRLQLTLVPKAMPQKWPSLPGPPKVGSVAPPLRLERYRGSPPTILADGKPRLLFFWATWCGICKAAVPELLAFESARGTEIVAITDETATELDPFFTAHTEPFVPLVVSDEDRRAFLAYGVSGTPTFVVVDGAGIVKHYATGYSRKKGLQIDGWRWEGAEAAVPGG